MQGFTKEEIDTLRKLKSSREERVAFFERHRDELHVLSKFRLPQRIKRRLSDSDVIQDAYLKYCSYLDQYLEDPKIPPVAWLRRLTRQVVYKINQKHLSTKCRDLKREEPFGERSMVDLDQLATSLSSVGKQIHGEELRETLFKILESMSPLEREILTLVHFESRTIREAAQEIGISLEAAKKRYCRSLNRLRRLHEQNLSPFLG